MSLISLPAEILLMITPDLQPHDLNALIQCHPVLHRALNPSLYRDNVHHHNASALFWCASSGSIKTLEYILAAGANVLWDSTYQPFQLGRQPLQVGRISLERGQYLKKPPPAEEHPISFAATNGHIDIVIKFIELGVNIDYKDPIGRNPLSLAARGGHLKLSQMLLGHGADLLSVDNDGMHPMDHAVVQGHREVEEFLFEELCKRFDTGDTAGQSIIKQHLHWMLRCAAERGENDRIKWLLTKDESDPNYIPLPLQESLVPDTRGDFWYPTPWRSYTPLIGAIQSAPDPLSTVKILLENGADPNILVAIRNPFITNDFLGMYENAVSAALGRDQSYSLIELQIEYGLNATNSEMALIRATHLMKTDEFRLLIDNGAYYLKEAQGIWNIGYRPIMDLLTERGIHSEVRSPLRKFGEMDTFDFDKFLNASADDQDPFGFDQSIESQTPQTPPPQTKTEWTMYLNGHMDDNPYPYFRGNGGLHCATGDIEAFQESL